MKVEPFFKNKKVLLVGLGVLGGGVATSKFILKEKGELRVTDVKDAIFLKKSIAQLPSAVSYTLNGYKDEDFKWADVVVFNPFESIYRDAYKKAKKLKKVIYNDFTLFQSYLDHTGNLTPQVWVTGTRGKTTTTLWIAHLLDSGAVIGGNIVGNGLQKICYKKGTHFVLETSNYQLEYPLVTKRPLPEVAVLTNIFTDHINRHGSFTEYKRVKHIVFSYQKEKGALLLNKKEKSVSDVKRSNTRDISKINLTQYTSKVFPAHQEDALKFAITVAKYFNVSDKDIKTRIKSLPQIPMRQELIAKVEGTSYINDSAATSPDALLAAMKAYPKAFFIIGGTNADLDFTSLIKYLKKEKIINLVFLAGTATDEIIRRLKNKDPLILSSMDDAVYVATVLAKKARAKEIILSPGAKSFGIFKNEFDRGDKFNASVKRIIKGKAK